MSGFLLLDSLVFVRDGLVAALLTKLRFFDDSKALVVPILEVQQHLVDGGLCVFIEIRVDRDVPWTSWVALAFRPQPGRLQPPPGQRAKQINQPKENVEAEVGVVEQQALIGEIANDHLPVFALADTRFVPIEQLGAALGISADQLKTS